MKTQMLPLTALIFTSVLSISSASAQDMGQQTGQAPGMPPMSASQGAMNPTAPMTAPMAGGGMAMPGAPAATGGVPIGAAPDMSGTGMAPNMAAPNAAVDPANPANPALAGMPVDPNAPPAIGPDGKPVAATTPAPPVTEFTQSFFFTDEQAEKIREAASGRIEKNGEKEAVVIPPIRRIILSGIYFRGPGDWTIWMNGKKVTPKTLLPEIVDINVINDRIHLKWYDIGLNSIIALEMRPHQVYDIGTGIMLKE